MAIEASTGFYELQNNAFLLKEAPQDVTAFGTTVLRIHMLEGYTRLKGLQRDPWMFANLMAVSGLFCAWAAWCQRGWLRYLGLLCSFPFAYLCFFSTGRSGLTGLLGGLLFLCCGGVFRRSRFVFRFLPVAAIVIAVFVTLSGILPIVTFVSEKVFGESYIGNVESSADRDEVWAMVMYKLTAQEPLSLIVGAPLVAVFDPTVTPYLIADNMYLYLVYHTGLAGLFVVVSMLTMPFLLLRKDDVISETHLLWFVFCGFVIASGVGLESIFYATTPFLLIPYGMIMTGVTLQRKSLRRSREANAGEVGSTRAAIPGCSR